jgi:elongation factor 1 alpha-like protein
VRDLELSELNFEEDNRLTSRGVTIDIATTHFETPHRNITLLDAPGHKDFIPAMISGAAQADVALMVVDGSPGEFEAGFDRGGQTREHAWLVRSLGVKEIIIGINKMDMVCVPPAGGALLID